MSVQQAVAYRGRTLMTLLSNLVWVAMIYYLWKTVYTGAGTIQGFSWVEMRSYILLSNAINMLLSFFSAGRMMSSIRTGEIAQDLLRPVDYMYSQLAMTAGLMVIEGLLSTAATLVLGVFVIGMVPPVSWLAAALFMVSILLGFLIKFLVSFVTSLLCFWTVNSVGLLWAQSALINLFSGMLIPLAFLPDWLRIAAQWLPFQGIIYTPVMIYLGRVQGSGLWLALGGQVFWVAVLWLAAQAFWQRAVKALDIQGG
jgi:ABC-2 type transport system permease protein